MWMTDYIKCIQKRLVIEYGFEPNEDGLPMDVIDGAYPMRVGAREIDLVIVRNGKISCCNFIADGGLKDFQEMAREWIKIDKSKREAECQKKTGLK